VKTRSVGESNLDGTRFSYLGQSNSPDIDSWVVRIPQSR